MDKPRMPMSAKRVLKSALFLAGLSLICLNFFSLIIKYAVDMPFWDEWNASPYIIGNPPLSKILFAQHNEHRIGFGLLIMKMLASFSHWSQIWEIRFVAFLILSSTAALLLVKYKIDKKVSLLDLFIPLVMLNIFQWENLVWGFQIAFVLPLFFLTIWLLTATNVKNSAARNTILTMVSLLASYSVIQGLLLPFITILLVLFEWLRNRKGDKAAFIAAAVNALIIASYFIGYKFGMIQDAALRSSINEGRLLIKVNVLVAYFLQSVRTGFLFNPKGFGASYASGKFIGSLFLTLVTALLCLIGIFRFYNDKNAHNSFVGSVLVLFSLLFISLITAGRTSYGVAPRYVTYTMLIPAGLFFIFSDLKYGRYLKIILFAVILINTINYNKEIMKTVKDRIYPERAAVECYKKLGPSGECYKIFPLYPNQDRLNSLMPGVFKYKKINLGSAGSGIDRHPGLSNNQ